MPRLDLLSALTLLLASLAVPHAAAQDVEGVATTTGSVRLSRTEACHEVTVEATITLPSRVEATEPFLAAFDIHEEWRPTCPDQSSAPIDRTEALSPSDAPRLLLFSDSLDQDQALACATKISECDPPTLDPEHVPLAEPDSAQGTVRLVIGEDTARTIDIEGSVSLEVQPAAQAAVTPGPRKVYWWNLYIPGQSPDAIDVPTVEVVNEGEPAVEATVPEDLPPPAPATDDSGDWVNGALIGAIVGLALAGVVWFIRRRVSEPGRGERSGLS